MEAPKLNERINLEDYGIYFQLTGPVINPVNVPGYAYTITLHIGKHQMHHAFVISEEDIERQVHPGQTKMLIKAFAESSIKIFFRKMISDLSEKGDHNDGKTSS